MNPGDTAGDGGDAGSGVTLLGATRVVALWDFDGREDRLFEIPPGWFRSVHDPEADPPSYRPGFPLFNLGKVERVPGGPEGAYAVKLPTSGGSSSLMLARGRLVAMPGSDYMVTARVRTDGLEYAAARIGVRFVDNALEPLDGAGVMSEPVRTDGGWTTVRVRLEGREEAAYLQIELQLAQPDVLNPTQAVPFEVRHEDFGGSAWFDDVRLYQVPRIDFSGTDERNVVVAPASPELRLRVQDFTGETLVADARVYDVSGHLVDEKRLVDGGDTGAGSSSSVSWAPALPGFGWYRAVVLLSNEQGVVGQRACDIAWLAQGPEGDADDRSGFGVVLGEVGELGGVDEVTALLDELRTGSAWLGVWETPRGGGASEWSEDDFEGVRRLVERLVDRHQLLTFVLSATPKALADSARTDVDDVLGVFRDEAEASVSSLRGVLTRFSESASSWHLGAVGRAETSDTGEVEASVMAALDEMSKEVPRPRVSVAWGASSPVRGFDAEARRVTLRVPGWATRETVMELVGGWERAGSDVEPVLVFPWEGEETFGTEVLLDRLVRLAVAGWEAGAPVMAIERPWRRALDGRGGAMPTPPFTVWRVLSEELSGRRPVAELYAGKGARAIVGDGGAPGTGVIVAWNDFARPGEAEIRALLANGPVTVRDRFGNETMVYREDNEHVIPLGPEPVFIRGIDTELVLFRSGLKLVPGFLESRAQRHALELEISNPWREAIQVALRFATPEGWEYGPRVVRASVPGGGRVRVPVEVALGVGETSGVREVLTEVALTNAQGEQPVQRVPLFVELGMKELRVTPSYRYTTGADGKVDGVVVSLLIANTGDREIPLQSFAFAPGYAAKETLIPSLGPGQAIVRRFNFKNAADLVGQRVRAGVREINGNGRLNYWVELR